MPQSEEFLHAGDRIGDRVLPAHGAPRHGRREVRGRDADIVLRLQIGHGLNPSRRGRCDLLDIDEERLELGRLRVGVADRRR